MELNNLQFSETQIDIGWHITMIVENDALCRVTYK